MNIIGAAEVNRGTLGCQIGSAHMVGAQDGFPTKAALLESFYKPMGVSLFPASMGADSLDPDPLGVLLFDVPESQHGAQLHEGVGVHNVADAKSDKMLHANNTIMVEVPKNNSG